MKPLNRFARIFISMIALLSCFGIATNFVDVIPHQAAPGASFAIQIEGTAYPTTRCNSAGTLAGSPKLYIGHVQIPTGSCANDEGTIWIEATIPTDIGLEGWQHLSIRDIEKSNADGILPKDWLNFQIIPKYEGVGWKSYELIGVFPDGYDKNEAHELIETYIASLITRFPKPLNLLKESLQNFEVSVEGLDKFGNISDCKKTLIIVTKTDERMLGIIIEASRVFGVSAGVGLAPNYMNGGESDSAMYSQSTFSQSIQMALLGQDSGVAVQNVETSLSNYALYILDSEPSDKKNDRFLNQAGKNVGHGSIVRQIAEMNMHENVIQSRQVCQSKICKIDSLYTVLCEVIADKKSNSKKNIVVNMSLVTPYDVPLLHLITSAADRAGIWLVTAYGNKDRCKKTEFTDDDYCNAYPADWLKELKTYLYPPPNYPFTHLISVGASNVGQFDKANYERQFSTSTQVRYEPTARALGSYYLSNDKGVTYNNYEGTSFSTPVISSAVLLKLALCSNYKLPDKAFKPKEKFNLERYLRCSPISH